MHRSESNHETRRGETAAPVLITGVTSIHGWPIYRALSDRFGSDRVIAIRPPKTTQPNGERVIPLCITDRRGLAEVRDRVRPGIVVHAGGVCDLDVCEERPDWAHELNVGGAQAIASVFGGSARIVFLSTDLVFSGSQPPAGGYREAHSPDPVSVVGRTFVEAERVIAGLPNSCTLRLGLPLGPSIQGSKGAVDWIEGRFRHGRKATLFYDEERSVIDVGELASCVAGSIEQGLVGLFHLGGGRPLSLYELGRRVLERGGHPGRLLEGRFRVAERDGPPRVGNVALNSSKLERALGRRVRPSRYSAIDAEASLSRSP